MVRVSSQVAPHTITSRATSASASPATRAFWRVSAGNRETMMDRATMLSTPSTNSSAISRASVTAES